MIFSLFHRVLNILRIYLFPSLCASCRKFLSISDILCSDCNNKIIPIVSKQIDLTQSFSMTVFAMSDYKEPLKKLILGKSWSDSLASYQLGQLLWQKTPISHLDYDVVVPIPLHWTRYAWRGFNQAEEIARVIARYKKVPLNHPIKRCKKTVYQSAVSSHARIENVKNAFELAITDTHYEGKHILLVDDLMTTGATLRAAGKVLLALKPKKITVLVACRVI
jgi:competence protein ComFC